MLWSMFSVLRKVRDYSASPILSLLLLSVLSARAENGPVRRYGAQQLRTYTVPVAEERKDVATLVM